MANDFNQITVAEVNTEDSGSTLMERFAKMLLSLKSSFSDFSRPANADVMAGQIRFDITRGVFEAWFGATVGWAPVYARKKVLKTSTQSIGADDHIVLASIAGGSGVLTMPEIVDDIADGDWMDGREFIIKNIHASAAVTIDGFGSETVGGAANLVLSAGEVVHLLGDRRESTPGSGTFDIKDWIVLYNATP